MSLIKVKGFTMRDIDREYYDLQNRLYEKQSELKEVELEMGVFRKKHKKYKQRKFNGWYLNLRFLWWYIMTWHNREEQPCELMEQLHIVTFSARRCAYDLAHAASFIDEKEGHWKEVFQNSSNHYQNIFTPWGGKEYRLELHERIYDLDKKVNMLEKLCDEKGLEIPYDTLPF